MKTSLRQRKVHVAEERSVPILHCHMVELDQEDPPRSLGAFASLIAFDQRPALFFAPFAMITSDKHVGRRVGDASPAPGQGTIMRLICPNCSAQYEIDASMIPDEGRDVQCSNCGHTWFEVPSAEAAETSAQAQTVTQPGPGPDAVSEEAAPIDTPSDAAAEKAPEPIPERDTATEIASPSEPSQSRAAAAVAAASRVASDRVEEEELDEFEVFGGPPKPRRPAGADKETLEFLKAEAEEELRKRRAPPSVPLETQDELGIEAVSGDRTPSRALKARMARVTGEEQEPKRRVEEEEPRADEEYEAPRKDLLPDIDEINSSLRPAAQDALSPEAEAARRSGFRLGFGLVVAAVALAIFAYVYAPTLARMFPSTESALISYVDWVNGLRDWLDGLFG